MSTVELTLIIWGISSVAIFLIGSFIMLSGGRKIESFFDWKQYDFKMIFFVLLSLPTIIVIGAIALVILFIIWLAVDNKEEEEKEGK